MQILTLASGDTITIGDVTPSAGAELSNDWTVLPPSADISYTIANETQPLPKASHNFLAWKIRTRLDINCGPTLGQLVDENQTFVFKDEDDNLYKIEAYTSGDNLITPSIALSQLVSASGGKNVDLTVTKISTSGVSAPACELSVFTYQSSDVSYEVSTGGSRLMTASNGYYTIPVSALKYTSDAYALILPVLATANKTTLIMFYVSKDKLADYTITVSDSKVYSAAGSSYGTVTLCDNTIGDKITVIEVDPSANSVTINVTRGNGETAECNLVMSGLSKANHEGSLVLNPAFGLTSAEEDALKTKVSQLDENGVFYYNSPLDKGSIIDAADIQSPDFFWDRNNLFNKFTLGEIDFDDDGTTIEIVNSSRL